MLLFVAVVVVGFVVVVVDVGVVAVVVVVVVKTYFNTRFESQKYVKTLKTIFENKRLVHVHTPGMYTCAKPENSRKLHTSSIEIL